MTDDVAEKDMLLCVSSDPERGPSFGLGVSVSPVWVSDDEVDLMARAASIAAQNGASTFLMGDKAGSDQRFRSNGVLLGWVLGELKGVPRVGSLFLVRHIPRSTLTVTIRTLVSLIRAQGSTPAIGVMRGRGTPQSGISAFDVEGAVAAIRNDEGMRQSEVWVAADEGTALDRAGRVGDAWLANAHYDDVTLEQQCGRVQSAAVGRIRMAVRRDIVCDADGSRARAQAQDLIAGGYRGGKFGDRSLIAGDPSECVERLARFAALGFDEVVVRPAISGPEGIDQLQALFEHWRNVGP